MQGHTYQGDSHAPYRNRQFPPQSLPPRRCYICNDTGHLAKDCAKTRKSESTSKASQLQVTTESNVNTDSVTQSNKQLMSLLELLLSDDDDNVICEVRITDKGSKSRCINVQVHGVE